MNPPVGAALTAAVSREQVLSGRGRQVEIRAQWPYRYLAIGQEADEDPATSPGQVVLKEAFVAGGVGIGIDVDHAFDPRIEPLVSILKRGWVLRSGVKRVAWKIPLARIHHVRRKEKEIHVLMVERCYPGIVRTVICHVGEEGIGRAMGTKDGAACDSKNVLTTPAVPWSLQTVTVRGTIALKLSYAGSWLSKYRTAAPAPEQSPTAIRIHGRTRAQYLPMPKPRIT